MKGLLHVEMFPPEIITKGIPDILNASAENMWKAAVGSKGIDAELVVDMKCPMKLLNIEMINGEGDFGIREFSVHGSKELDGPWKILHQSKLDEGGLKVNRFLFSEEFYKS